MCYNAAIEAGLFAVLEWILGRQLVLHEPFDVIPQVNAMARPRVPTITMEQPDAVSGVNWLMIPPWITTSDDLPAVKIWSANARIEELERKKLYAPLLETQRCIVSFSAFFEWRHEGRTKVKHVVRLPDNEPLLLPGLYRSGELDGQPYRSCTVCTMEARGIMRYIHNRALRQPVVVPPTAACGWLDPSIAFPAARDMLLAAERSAEFVTDPPAPGDLFD